jgi:hypothetical protein
MEKEVRYEFPEDPMLMELHILRAIRSYAAKNRNVALVNTMENYLPVEIISPPEL